MSTNLAEEAQSASTATFVTAIVFNAAVFAAEILVFTLLRPRFKAIYEPRTYVPPPSKRIQPLSSSTFLWPLAVFNADYKAIIAANGMDAYVFVRFLRMMVKIFLPIWLISWAVLLPVTSVRTRVGMNDGLDIFSFGNVAQDKQQRYAAHIILVYFFTAWIFYNIKHEMSHFIIARQQHLIEPVHAKSVQANTILITGIPARYLNQAALMKLFQELPGGVKKIWINRNLKELPDIYDRRLAACAKLESAETALLKTGAKLRLASLKKGADPEAADAAMVVPADQRPQHRLGLPFISKKVDTIEWAREEIRLCTEILDGARAAMEIDGEGTRVADDAVDGVDVEYPVLNSAFVTFNKQIAAHLGMQVLTHHEPYRMAGKFVEVSPEDVIWANLSLNPYEQRVRMVIGFAATAALIIFWSIPVAFVGIVSNIHTVCKQAAFLGWICDLPKPVVGIISGVLPPVLLAVLMMLLPIVLRLFARFEGIPKKTGLELALMNRFFVFQVIHGFLIVTISSGIVAALPGLINNPTGIPSILATKLPMGSTFFLTFILLQGLSGTAGGFLQIVPLVIYYVKLFILGSTPRAVYGIKYGLGSVAWGTLFPGITLLVVIALGYSIISPIINGLACATFFAFYQLYKYLFLWTFHQPPTSDTGGMFFPKAIQHLFVGLYVQQVCLCGLFFLAQDQNGNPGAIPEGALMVVLILFTIFFHVIINNSYGPLIHALPLSLADRTYTATGSQVEAKNAADSDSGADVDADARSPVSTEKRRSHDDGGSSVEKHRHTHAHTHVHHGATTDGASAKDSEHAELTEKHVATAAAIAEEEEAEYGFAHPAASRPQRTIWIPRDAMGAGEEEARACKEAGVKASVRGAEMNEKGRVDISSGPPDSVEM